MFTFSHHPTAIGVSDGIQDAFGYLQKSWRTWLLGRICDGVMFLV